MLGLAVAAVAGGLVLLVERRGARHPVAAAVPGVQRQASLRIESGFAVATWSVSVGRAPVVARHSDAGSWEGVIAAPAGSEVLIEATATAGHPQRCALRVVLDGDPQGERSAWGDGAVIATVVVP